METTDPYLIHPEEHGNINYWSRKWSVSARALHDAILTTGTLNTERIKEYLRRDSWFHHPIQGSMRALQSTINFMF